jgi:diguanylate cyclase (GGDEF)-like protein
LTSNSFIVQEIFWEDQFKSHHLKTLASLNHVLYQPLDVNSYLNSPASFSSDVMVFSIPKTHHHHAFVPVLLDLLGKDHPTLLLCENHDEELENLAFTCQVEDYFVEKHISEHHLLHSLKKAILRRHNRLQNLKDWIDLAQNDSLTRLPNRAVLYAHLKNLFSGLHYQHQQVGLVFVDIDNFKDINDQYGHMVGDKILVQVSSRLKSCLRGGDFIARFGGDEFVVVVNNVHQTRDLKLIARRLKRQFYKEFEGEENQLIKVSVCMGISLSSATTTPEGLIREADQAMYKAKGLGAGNIICNASCEDSKLLMVSDKEI